MRHYRLITAVCIGDVGASEAIQLVHRLRSRLAWEGGFLAIVEDNTEKKKLLELSVVGDREGRFRFGKLPGHAVLCLPLLLVDLLRTVEEMEEMSLEVWHSLLDQSSVGRLLEKLTEADKILEGSSNDERVGLARELLGEVGKIDWLPLLLDPHKDMRVLNALIEAYSPENSLEQKDFPTIIATIRQILLRTVIGVPRGTTAD